MALYVRTSAKTQVEALEQLALVVPLHFHVSHEDGASFSRIWGDDEEPLFNSLKARWECILLNASPWAPSVFDYRHAVDGTETRRVHCFGGTCHDASGEPEPWEALGGHTFAKGVAVTAEGAILAAEVNTWLGLYECASETAGLDAWAFAVSRWTGEGIGGPTRIEGVKFGPLRTWEERKVIGFRAPTQLIGAQVSNVTFDDCDLRYLVVERTSVSKAVFHRCDLGQLRMKNVRWQGVTFDLCSFASAKALASTETTQFVGCEFKRCDFGDFSPQNIEFIDCTFQDCRLARTTWHSARLERVRVTGSLHGCNFGQSSAPASKPCTLVQVDFRAVVSFFGCEFGSADASQALFPSTDDLAIVDGHHRQLLGDLEAILGNNHRQPWLANYRRCATTVARHVFDLRSIVQLLAATVPADTRRRVVEAITRAAAASRPV